MASRRSTINILSCPSVEDSGGLNCLPMYLPAYPWEQPIVRLHFHLDRGITLWPILIHSLYRTKEQPSTTYRSHRRIQITMYDATGKTD